jgi:hypothetical protein
MTRDELTAKVFEERNLLDAEVQYLRNECIRLLANVTALEDENQRLAALLAATLVLDDKNLKSFGIPFVKRAAE